MHPYERPVRAWLASPVHTIADSASADAAAASLRALEVSSLLVVDSDGGGVGVVSRTDLLHGSGDSVRERMSVGVVTVGADDSVARAAELMVAQRVHRVYVLDEGRPLGVFSTREVLLAVREAKDATPLADLMSSPVRTVSFDETAQEATALLGDGAIGALVVVENDHPIGLFTQREALAARWAAPATQVESLMSPSLLCLQTTVPAHRAAAFTVSTRARRIVAIHAHEMRGVVSGMDFARLAANGLTPEPFSSRNVGSQRA